MPIEISPIEVTELAAVGRVDRLSFTYSGASSHYAVIRQPGKAWNGEAMTPFIADEWATYAIPAVRHQGSYHTLQLPAGLAPGTYVVNLYQQQGEAPAYPTDASGFYTMAIELIDTSSGLTVEQDRKLDAIHSRAGSA